MTMRYKKIYSLCICLILVINTCYSIELEKTPHEYCKIVNHTFSDLIISLSSRIAKEIPLDESFILSPLSITAALTMLYVGADGITKTQMNRALNFDEIIKSLKTKESDSSLIEQTINNPTDAVTDINLSLLNTPGTQKNHYVSANKKENFSSISNLTESFILHAKYPSETATYHEVRSHETKEKINESRRLQRDLSQLGETRRQSTDIKILDEFRDLILTLEKENDVMSLMVANSVFVQKGFQVSPEFFYKIQEYFNSEIHYEDFAKEELKSMEDINEWVSKKTGSQIKKLLKEPLDKMTMMVLANVVYFKGLWQYPFYESWSSHFKSIKGTRNSVTYMKVEEYFNYYHDDSINYSFLEMNYNGGNTSMILILPQNKSELPNFLLTSESLCYIRSKFQMRNVVVGLPKVQLAYSRELSKDMVRLGMSSLFSDRADLSGIRKENDIHVSLMLHKSVIEIDEEGSKASAITGVGIDSRKRPMYDAIFWANHPFLYYIIEKTTNTVLFVGRVTHL